MVSSWSPRAGKHRVRQAQILIGCGLAERSSRAHNLSKYIRVIGCVGTPLLDLFHHSGRTALYIYMQKQAHYTSLTRPDTQGGNLPPPV